MTREPLAPGWTLRLPQTVQDWVRTEANRQDRSINWVVRDIVTRAHKQATQ